MHRHRPALRNHRTLFPKGVSRGLEPRVCSVFIFVWHWCSWRRDDDGKDGSIHGRARGDSGAGVGVGGHDGGQHGEVQDGGGGGAEDVRKCDAGVHEGDGEEYWGAAGSVACGAEGGRAGDEGSDGSADEGWDDGDRTERGGAWRPGAAATDGADGDGGGTP